MMTLNPFVVHMIVRNKPLVKYINLTSKFRQPTAGPLGDAKHSNRATQRQPIKLNAGFVNPTSSLSLRSYESFNNISSVALTKASTIAGSFDA